MDSRANLEGDDVPQFRSAKRRKIFRRRGAEDDDESGRQSTPGEQNDTPPDGAQNEDDANLDLQAILRRRKAKTYRGGVGSRPVPSQAAASRAVALSATEAAEPETSLTAVERAAGRFAPQTGNTGESMDKHLVAYIEDSMARMRGNGEQVSPAVHNMQHVNDSATRTGPAHDDRRRVPAAMGRLEEIDIASFRNGSGGAVDKPGASRAQKDGKGRRHRRDRRGSGDAERDALVEAIMQEARLDNIYSAADDAPQRTAAGFDLTADQRVAEEFEREFLNSMEERARQHAPKPPPTQSRGPAGAKQDLLKGPKLGGSRSARAAMHAAAQQQQPKAPGQK